jgi:hypothetical protein
MEIRKFRQVKKKIIFQILIIFMLDFCQSNRITIYYKMLYNGPQVSTQFKEIPIYNFLRQSTLNPIFILYALIKYS